MVFLSVLCISFAQSYPEFLTKQDVSNIRFLSEDGKITYYQTVNGDLYLSTNYSVQEILKGKRNDQYLMVSGPEHKYLLIAWNDFYQSYLSINRNQKIYYLTYGGFQAQSLGEGLLPLLHNNESWASFFNTQENRIYFKSLSKAPLEFSIHIKNFVNKYFIPARAMLDDQKLLYTDINKSGYPAVMSVNRQDKNPNIFLLLNRREANIEICEGKNHIIIGEFGLHDVNQGTKIYTLSKKDFDPKKMKLIYKSDLNDLGNIICNIEEDQIYFIQKMSKESTLGRNTQFVSLDIKLKKQIVFDNTPPAISFFSMDKRLIAVFGGKYYVLKGSNKANKDGLEK